MHTVIFTGGESPSPEAARAYFTRRPPDKVIAADSGLETLARYQAFFGRGFAPSAILGDMDSLGDRSLLKRWPEAQVQTFPRDKDWSDTELALHLACKGAGADTAEAAPFSAPFITLVGAGGGRADHFLAVFDCFATRERPDVWLTPEQALWYAGAGSRFSIAGLEEKDALSVARTSAGRTGGRIQSCGLEWEWEHFRKEGLPSLSNRISRACCQAGGSVELTVAEGDFLLILPLHAEVTRLE